MLSLSQPSDQQLSLTGPKEKTGNANPKQEVPHKTSSRMPSAGAAARTRTPSAYGATWITSRMTTCASSMAKRGHQRVAKRVSWDQSSVSSSDDTSSPTAATEPDRSLGLENLFSVPDESIKEEEGSAAQVSPTMTPQKCPIEVKSATMYMRLPPYPAAAATPKEESEETPAVAASDAASGAETGGGQSDECQPDNSSGSEAGESALDMEPETSSHLGALCPEKKATELARTTWVLFPNGKYQIFVDYPNGVRKVFLSAPGATYKPGPHQVFVPTGGDPSRPGLVVPQDMVHLLLPFGIAVPQQQQPTPLAVPGTPPVMCR